MIDLTELHIARIISGSLRIDTSCGPLLIKWPSRELRYEANLIYQKSYYQAVSQGCYEESSLKDFLEKQGIWKPDEDIILSGIQKDIENLKVGLYKEKMKSRTKTIRKLLSSAKEKQSELLNRKHSYDHLACNGVASYSRAKFLISVSLYRPDNVLFLLNTERTHPIIDEALGIQSNSKLTESEYRKIARSEYWFSYWKCRKTEPIFFGVPAVDLTDEQRNLISWSSLYENIRECPDSPDSIIMEDDDLLDGWLINRKREQDKEKTENKSQSMQEKNPDAQEFFIPVSNIEELKEVENMNSPVAQATKIQREKFLKEKGRVEEADMPDTKLRLKMEMNRLEAEHYRKGKR